MNRHVGAAVVGLVCLLAVTPVVAPVQLSYVYSDSMEPTIGQDDGFVLVETSDVTVGDVVTFWSADGDQYVTHRVVGRTEEGYITRGDANPATDQSAGAPPVSPDDVRGRVLSVAGEPVVVPGLGHVVRAVRPHRLLLAGLAVVGLAASLLGGTGGRGRASPPSRDVPTVRDVLLPVFVVAVVTAVGVQFVGGYAQSFTYVAVEGETPGPTRLTVGEPATDSFVLERSQLPLTTSVVSADGMTVTNRTANESAVVISTRIPPPDRTGVVTTRLRVDRYVAVLPRGLLRHLHAIHPLLAATATVGTAMAPLLAAALLLVDWGRPVRPVESRRFRAIKRRWRGP